MFAPPKFPHYMKNNPVRFISFCHLSFKVVYRSFLPLNILESLSWSTFSTQNVNNRRKICISLS